MIMPGWDRSVCGENAQLMDSLSVVLVELVAAGSSRVFIK
jgi:hypothetical protein